MSFYLNLNTSVDSNHRPGLLNPWYDLSLDPNHLVTSNLPRGMTTTLNLTKPWLYLTPAQRRYPENTYLRNVDVQQFEPQEISVRVGGDNVITVECKHSEIQDEHGFISRHFVRKFLAPHGFDLGRLESTLSSDGVLTIAAPPIAEGVQSTYIPVIQTGQPSRSQKTGKNQGDNE